MEAVRTTVPVPDVPEAPAAGGRPGPDWTAHALLAVAAVLVAVGVVLRFWTRSNLWLDEALTVNIARQPLSHLHALLRRDGAPPLYYVLLHFWMEAFGSSDLGARSLSGVLSVLTLPFVAVAGRRLGGRGVAAAAVVLVATSPFAVRYGTEARMYSLVMLLVAAGVVALQRALQRPRPGNLVAVALCTAALLYSHYWSLYLLLVTGLWMAWLAWRRGREGRRAPLAVLGAMAVGGLTFVPWLPTFVFQTRHTGTPWAEPADFAAMVNAVSSFAGGNTNQGRALALMFFALAGLGLFGVARGRRHIDLDLRTRPRGRPYAAVLVGTLALAVVGGYVSASAFQARYAAVVFVPLLLLVSLGLTTFADRRARMVVLAAAVAFGLAGSFPDVTTQRTQAGKVAAVLDAHGRPGDVVAYCPDQLGPDTSRLLPAGRFTQLTFPRGTSPEFVDWVDYDAAVRAASPAAFARRVVADAHGHRIWLVWMGGYQGYGARCDEVATDIVADTGLPAYTVVSANGVKYYEPDNLIRFGPP